MSASDKVVPSVLLTLTGVSAVLVILNGLFGWGLPLMWLVLPMALPVILLVGFVLLVVLAFCVGFMGGIGKALFEWLEDLLRSSKGRK